MPRTNGSSAPSAAFDRISIDSPSAPPRSGRTSGATSPEVAEIPPEAFEEVAPSVQAEKVCPHCTFVNPPGRTDCEICGLPMDE